jgi:monofunctional glycosyltransferase
MLRCAAVRRLALLILLVVVALAGGLAALWFTLPDPAVYATREPRSTAIMDQRRAEAKAAGRPFKPMQHWVRLKDISPRLIDAVISSEDAGFFAHGAFDVGEVSAAARDAVSGRRKLRGASTITQQLARTLYLGNERTLWRKLREALLAIKIERVMSKQRILLLYLNAVEWGDGVFGADSAARSWFRVRPDDLDTAQSAILAAMLPAPRRVVDLASPPRWLSRRAEAVLDRMLAAGRISRQEHADATAQVREYLAGATGPDDEPPAT